MMAIGASRNLTGNDDADGCARAGSAVDGEGRVEFIGAFLNAEDAEVASGCGRGRIESPAIVTNLQRDGVRGVVQAEADFARRGVAGGITGRSASWAMRRR